MPILKPTEEVEFLDRVDGRWRNGVTQEAIAQGEGLGTAGSLHNKLHRIGFRLTRIGGPHLVTTLEGRDYAAMRAAGEIVAAEESVAA